MTRSAVAGHVESTYSKKTGKWTPPVFVEDPFLRIHGMAPGLNYVKQCYEGLKAFRAPDGNINIFRPNKNAERMQHSATFISIPEVPTDHFLECCKLAVGMNAAYVPPHETGAAIYVRPLLFGSSAQLGLNPPEEYTFLVYCIPTGVYHGTNPVSALVLEDFDRAAPKGTGSAKVGGNYAPVLRWSEKAHSEGYGITLHLDSQTRSVIDEFSTSAFIGVKKDGEKVKLVLYSSFLPSSRSGMLPPTRYTLASFASCDSAWKVGDCDSVGGDGRSVSAYLSKYLVPYGELKDNKLRALFRCFKHLCACVLQVLCLVSSRC